MVANLISFSLKARLVGIFRRFIKYSAVGLSTFLFDITIVYGITYFFTMHYATAVAIGFIVGLSVNYLITYQYVFKGTERQKFEGYIIFISLGFLGMVLIVSGTSILVETFGIQFLLARSLVGATSGIVGFFVNAHFNFKML